MSRLSEYTNSLGHEVVCPPGKTIPASQDQAKSPETYPIQNMVICVLQETPRLILSKDRKRRVDRNAKPGTDLSEFIPLVGDGLAASDSSKLVRRCARLDDSPFNDEMGVVKLWLVRLGTLVGQGESDDSLAMKPCQVDMIC